MLHPLLDRAEGMFDRLAAMVHHLGSGSKPIRHPLHNGLVLVAGDGPISACGALTAQSTARTGRTVGVVNHMRFAPCFADAGAPYRNQTCARGTGISIRFSIVPERRLRKLTTAPGFAPVRLRNIRRDPQKSRSSRCPRSCSTLCPPPASI